MAIPSAYESVNTDLNGIIATLIAERDRLNILFKASLPGTVTIWNVVSAEVRASVITDCQGKLATANAILADTVDKVAAL